MYKWSQLLANLDSDSETRALAELDSDAETSSSYTDLPCFTPRKKSFHTYYVLADSDDEWGVKWNGTKIEALNKHKQFYQVGIRLGWRLLRIDGYLAQRENFLLERGMSCMLRFHTDKLKVGDQVEIFHVRNREYEGMRGYLVEELVDEFKWRMYVTGTNSIKRIPVANVVKINRQPRKRRRRRRRRYSDEEEENDDDYEDEERERPRRRRRRRRYSDEEEENDDEDEEEERERRKRRRRRYSDEEEENEDDDEEEELEERRRWRRRREEEDYEEGDSDEDCPRRRRRWRKKREEEEYEGIVANESYRRPKCWNCESYLIWVESLEQLISYDSEYDEGYGCDICDDFPNGSFPMWHCGNGCAFDGCVKCFGNKKEREEVIYDEQDPEYFVLTDDGWICSLPLSSANAKLFDDWFLPFLDQELNWDESEMIGKIISSFFK